MTQLQRIIARVQGLAIDLNRLDAEKSSVPDEQMAWTLRALCEDVTTIGTLLLMEASSIEKRVRKVDHGPSHPA